MKPSSILLVDDNHIALKELTNILRYVNYENIDQAKSGNEAWTLLKNNTYDCIITSWDMPDMSGLALLKIIRKEDRYTDTPFFLTHSAFTKLKVIQAGQAGVTGLIVRPYDLENVTLKMDQIAHIEKDPDISDKTQKYEAGLALIEEKKFDHALEIFENLITQSESAEYWYNIGFIKTSQEKYGEAIQAFQKATQLNRLFVKAFEAMGRTYHLMGKKDDAIKCLQKAAHIHMEKGEIENAEDLLNEVLEINPDTLNVFNSLGVLYRKKGKLKKALEQYLKALKIHPKEPHILYNVGRLYVDMKNFDKAKIFFAKAIKYNPDFKEAKEVLKAINMGSIESFFR
ncbi:MAG: tetratricopeptide repeat protein [Proteobacteria bacterium]|nr:tetratricopeptide repeat protein [Pseudomonadota bacterium]